MAKRSHTLVHFWLIQMKGNATIHYNATTVPFCTQSKVNEDFFSWAFSYFNDAFYFMEQNVNLMNLWQSQTLLKSGGKLFQRHHAIIHSCGMRRV